MLDIIDRPPPPWEGNALARTIATSIRQKRAFASLQEEALIDLYRAWDRIRDVVRRPLDEAGLSQEQYNVLRILRGAGPEGLRTYEVVERMVTRAPNITRLVDKLERKGYLERSRSARDHRVIRLAVTRSGLSLLERLDAPVTGSAKEAMAGLTPEQLKRLIRLLDRLREPLES
jgi:DNA-binding MarR family transcriptional regulator